MFRFGTENVNSLFLRKVRTYLPMSTVSHSGRPFSSPAILIINNVVLITVCVSVTDILVFGSHADVGSRKLFESSPCVLARAEIQLLRKRGVASR